jgi:large subunit ribosomal protein L10
MSSKTEKISPTKTISHPLFSFPHLHRLPMEATALLSFPSSKPHASHSLTQTHHHFLSNPPLISPRCKPKLSIRSAISHNKKEETVETVKTQLDNCHLIAGIK